jgi:hypothetical protein
LLSIKTRWLIHSSLLTNETTTFNSNSAIRTGNVKLRLLSLKAKKLKQFLKSMVLPGMITRWKAKTTAEMKTEKFVYSSLISLICH